jgi:hypothetical protein
MHNCAQNHQNEKQKVERTKHTFSQDCDSARRRTRLYTSVRNLFISWHSVTLKGNEVRRTQTFHGFALLRYTHTKLSRLFKPLWRK